MTNHFVRSTTRRNPVLVSRVSERAWSVVLPLPVEVSCPVSKFDSTFGYPIDLACLCSNSSTDSCSCSHETVFEFWSELSDFVCAYADCSGQTSAIESLRRRFVQFYIDLPSMELAGVAFGNRKLLIADAESVYRRSLPDGPDLAWLEWPVLIHHSELTEDEMAELFAADVCVLSHVRSVVSRNFSTLVSVRPPLESLLADCSPVTLLQIACALDQLNMVAISSDILTLFSASEAEFADAVPYSFVLRVNRTLSRSNVMKNRFFSVQLEPTPLGFSAPKSGGLEKFREKLSQMLLYRKRSWTNYAPLPFDSPSSPVDEYNTARRSVVPPVVAAEPPFSTSEQISPFKARFVETGIVNCDTQTDVPSPLHGTLRVRPLTVAEPRNERPRAMAEPRKENVITTAESKDERTTRIEEKLEDLLRRSLSRSDVGEDKLSLQKLRDRAGGLVLSKSRVDQVLPEPVVAVTGSQALPERIGQADLPKTTVPVIETKTEKRKPVGEAEHFLVTKQAVPPIVDWASVAEADLDALINK